MSEQDFLLNGIPGGLIFMAPNGVPPLTDSERKRLESVKNRSDVVEAREAVDNATPETREDLLRKFNEVWRRAVDAAVLDALADEHDTLAYRELTGEKLSPEESVRVRELRVAIAEALPGMVTKLSPEVVAAMDEARRLLGTGGMIGV